MSCKYIIEDSSFIISLMNPPDKFHNRSLDLFKKIITLSYKSKIKTVIPSIAFYETTLTLLKNGIDYKTVKMKLVNLMMIDHIINFPITETYILKIARYADSLIKNTPLKTAVRSNDLMILSIAMDFENSCLLTIDHGMKDYKKVYSNIYSLDDKADINDFLQFLTV